MPEVAGWSRKQRGSGRKWRAHWSGCPHYSRRSQKHREGKCLLMRLKAFREYFGEQDAWCLFDQDPQLDEWRHCAYFQWGRAETAMRGDG